MASDIFPERIRNEAGERQDWLCALCGAPLQDEDEVRYVYYEAHHRDGNPMNTEDPDNCVLLCRQEARNCHLLMHRWHFGPNTAVVGYEYRFFDGKPSKYDYDELGEADD